MKPIINLEFSGEIPLDECQIYFKEVSKELRNEDCHLIGTFKPYMEIKEIFEYSTILKFDSKDYTVKEIIEALRDYEKKRMEEQNETD